MKIIIDCLDMSLIGQVDCLYVLHVLHVLNMPMDASLACWALFSYFLLLPLPHLRP